VFLERVQWLLQGRERGGGWDRGERGIQALEAFGDKGEGGVQRVVRFLHVVDAVA
jgi:hypothetical protein